MGQCYSSTRDGEARAEARKDQQRIPAAVGGRSSDGITQGLTRILRAGGLPTSSVSHIQRGVTLTKALVGANWFTVCHLDQVASLRTWRWREEIDGWDLYARTSLASRQV